MKKIKQTKLTLDTETIRQLDDNVLKHVAGGFTTIICGTFTATQHCNTVNPCNTGPTQTLCMTYVQATCGC